MRGGTPNAFLALLWASKNRLISSVSLALASTMVIELNSRINNEKMLEKIKGDGAIAIGFRRYVYVGQQDEERNQTTSYVLY